MGGASTHWREWGETFHLSVGCPREGVWKKIDSIRHDAASRVLKRICAVFETKRTDGVAKQRYLAMNVLSNNHR